MRRASLKSLDIVERLQIGISLLLQLAILMVIFGALFKQQWLTAVTGSVALALTFAPSAIERQFKVQLPIEFTLAACGFLYASFGLGEIRGFYARFWWWDLMLHSFSALVMGLIGFLMIYVFYMTNRVRIAPIYVATISFGFAVTFGTLWELFEFGMDWSFGFDMQKSGLFDTMTDLAVNTVGSLISAIIGYAYVKSGDSLIADRIIRHFVARNPNLFTRKRRSK